MAVNLVKASKQYIDYSTTMGTALGSLSSLAVSLWVNPPGALTNDGMFNIGSFASAQGNVVMAHGGNVFCRLNNTAVTINGSALSTNVWTHLLLNYTGTTFRLYKNGVQDATANYSTAVNLTGLKTIVGAYHSLNTSFNGKFFDVRFYSASLSLAEIATIYHSKGNDNINHDLELRALYNEGTSGATMTTPLDLSTNGYTGTPASSPTYLEAPLKII